MFFAYLIFENKFYIFGLHSSVIVMLLFLSRVTKYLQKHESHLYY